MKTYKLAYVQDGTTGYFILFQRVGGVDKELIKTKNLSSMIDILDTNFEAVGKTRNYCLYVKK
tara:strand:+ start:3170 stop:3358 length:189 start_codon:yes stop_codon:yes gene_type:complete